MSDNTEQAKKAQEFIGRMERGFASASIFTVFSLIKKMKRQLCLEAMLDYIDVYTECFELNCPQAARTVEKALEGIDVGKMYKKTVG